MRLGFNSSPKEKIWLIVIITAGLINGLLHTLLVPPWQHYDEPGHFEYAWLIANKPGLPEPGEYVQSMRLEVAASMIEHDFFAKMGFRPNLLSMSEPVWIGISQTNDQPVYYMLIAIPLYLVRTSDITFQLYLGRMVSLGLFLLTLFGSYAIISELTIPGSSLRLLIPATVAIIPAFADMMTAVNNDVGAAAFFTLFLWLSVRMLQRGPTWLNLILVSLLAVICIFTKSTAILVIPLTVVVLILSILPQAKRIFGWAAFSFISLVLLVLIMTFDGVAYWHEQTHEILNRHVKTNLALVGDYALEIEMLPDISATSAIQVIPENQSKYLSGESVTVGAWIWASSPIQIRTPSLDDGTNIFFNTIHVETSPEFYTYTAQIDDFTNQLLVRLQTIRQPRDANASIFYDGIILVEGDHSLDGKPSFLDVNGERVEWGAERLTNFIRNASFEKSAPRFRPQVDDILASYLPDRLSLVISSFVDLEGYRAYYSSAVQHLFRSFWAIFGWGQVVLIGSKPYRILLIISLIALVGDVIYVWKNRRGLPWHTLGVLGIALLGVWGMAATRGVSSVFSNLFIPAARYAYPVVVPSVLLFVAGWRELLRIMGERLKIPQAFQNAAYISFLLILNAISIYSIWLYYDSV